MVDRFQSLPQTRRTTFFLWKDQAEHGRFFQMNDFIYEMMLSRLNTKCFYFSKLLLMDFLMLLNRLNTKCFGIRKFSCWWIFWCWVDSTQSVLLQQVQLLMDFLMLLSRLKTQCFGFSKFSRWWIFHSLLVYWHFTVINES